MAEEQDKSQQTEQPTQRHIEKARKRGSVIQSRELNNLAMFAAAAVAFGMIVPYAFNDIALTLRSFFEMSSLIDMDAMMILQLLTKLLLKIGGSLSLIALLFMFVAVVSGGAQTRFNVSTERIKPKFEKISAAKGLKRMFSTKNVVELLKAIAKLAAIGLILYFLFSDELYNIEYFTQLTIGQILIQLSNKFNYLLLSILIFLVFVAALDYTYQWYEYTQSLKMTKQQVKDELKDTEGNPYVKQKIRQMMQDTSKKSVTLRVPEATVVITNPTHYSVALRYEMDEMDVPIVVAKGVDHMAFKIREIAKEHNIPIVENPPLARELYANIEIDQPIEEKHYEAVARVIRHVMQLSKKKVS